MMQVVFAVRYVRFPTPFFDGFRFARRKQCRPADELVDPAPDRDADERRSPDEHYRIAPRKRVRYGVPRREDPYGARESSDIVDDALRTVGGQLALQIGVHRVRRSHVRFAHARHRRGALPRRAGLDRHAVRTAHDGGVLRRRELGDRLAGGVRKRPLARR